MRKRLQHAVAAALRGGVGADVEAAGERGAGRCALQEEARAPEQDANSLAAGELSWAGQGCRE